MSALDGRWKVRRESGFLPPIGIRKFIAGDHGWTLVAGFIPIAPFKVKGTELVYNLWPVRDEVLLKDGKWFGRGYIFGKKFCEFSLESAQEPIPVRKEEQVVH